MSDLYIPDVSEYQGAIDWARLAAACPAVIIRLHNGYRLDTYGVANRSGAHAHGCRAVGLYQYLPAAVDPATAAHEFCDAIGSLGPGEWPILDLEEGTGDQSGRAHTWYTTVAGRLHDASSEELYSGEAFYAAHRLSAAGFARIWLAAYGSAEPSPAHELWQFTDARSFPGVSGPCDASVYHGALTDLLAHITPEADMPLTDTDLQKVADTVWNHQETNVANGKAVRMGTVLRYLDFMRDLQTNALTAQLGALSAAVQALVKDGGLTAEQVQAAAKAGADEALAELGKTLAAASPAGGTAPAPSAGSGAAG